MGTVCRPGLQAQLLLWVPCSFKTSRLPSLGWVVWAEPRPRPQPGSREVQVPPHQAPGSPDPSPRRELCPAPHPAQVQGSCSHRGLRLPGCGRCLTPWGRIPSRAGALCTPLPAGSEGAAPAAWLGQPCARSTASPRLGGQGSPHPPRLSLHGPGVGRQFLPSPLNGGGSGSRPRLSAEGGSQATTNTVILSQARPTVGRGPLGVRAPYGNEAAARPAAPAPSLPPPPGQPHGEGQRTEGSGPRGAPASVQGPGDGHWA